MTASRDTHSEASTCSAIAALVARREALTARSLVRDELDPATVRDTRTGVQVSATTRPTACGADAATTPPVVPRESEEARAARLLRADAATLEIPPSASMSAATPSPAMLSDAAGEGIINSAGVVPAPESETHAASSTPVTSAGGGATSPSPPSPATCPVDEVAARRALRDAARAEKDAAHAAHIAAQRQAMAVARADLRVDRARRLVCRRMGLPITFLAECPPEPVTRWGPGGEVYADLVAANR